MIYLKKKALFPLITALAVFVLTLVSMIAEPFYGIDISARDALYQRSRGINSKIKIIAIDDASLQVIGPLGTWSRSVYADIIDKVADNAAVLAFDIMIFGNTDSEGDTAFIEACKKHDNIVCGSYINFASDGKIFSYDENGSVTGIDYYAVDNIEYPIGGSVCSTGFVNTSPDSDGIVRKVMLTAESDGHTENNLDMQIYSLYCGKKGITPNSPVNAGINTMQIDYASRPGEYENLSLSRILNGEIDPRVFNDCIVYVGAYTSGLGDQFAVPNSDELMNGVEVHANILQGLIDGKYPVAADKTMSALICAFAAMIIAFAATMQKPVISAVIMIISDAAYIFLMIMMFSWGIIVPLIYLPLYLFIGCIAGIIYHYITASSEKKRIQKAFKKYVAPQVVDEISKSGNYKIVLGGETRDIAVLFVDIRGFTPLSESLEPEQVVDILNSYLELTTTSIFKNGGTLDKFIGDATMAVFNAPFDLDDYVFRAVKTALDIVNGGNEIESKFMEKYGKSVAFGVGVNCGKAVVGNIGCSFRMDYTAIGDTVNTAARLEANAGRGKVYLSEYVYERVKDRITVEPVGEIPLKGKSKGVFVYSLTGITEESE